jgi:hypothetical protein
MVSPTVFSVPSTRATKSVEGISMALSFFAAAKALALSVPRRVSFFVTGWRYLNPVLFG